MLLVGGGGGSWGRGLGGLADVLVEADVDEGLDFLRSRMMGGGHAPGLDDVTGPGMEEGALDAALGLQGYHFRLVGAPENQPEIISRFNILKKESNLLLHQCSAKLMLEIA